MILSPIVYFGSKRRLMNQLLCYFPKDIDTFYDLFLGSGTVSLNVQAKKYVVNDLSDKIYEIHKVFKIYSEEYICNRILKVSEIFGLHNDLTNKPTIKKMNEKPYLLLRDYVNIHPSGFGWFVLSIYSFSNIIRFSKNNFNVSVGNGYFNQRVQKSIKDICNFYRKNVMLTNKSFADFDDVNFNKNDFVYLDPPYFNTNAVYNDTWTETDNKKFFAFVEKLNCKGVKFAISNIFSKDIEEFANKNGFIINHLNLNYILSDKHDEILITNYRTKQRTLF